MTKDQQTSHATQDERRRALDAVNECIASRKSCGRAGAGGLCDHLETIRQCLQERDPAGLVETLTSLEKLGTSWQGQGVMGSQMFVMGSAVAVPCREALAEYRGTKEDTAEQDSIDNGQFGVGA